MPRDLKSIISDHPIFYNLDDEFLDLLTGCTSNVRFREGQYIFHEDDDASHFYLLREGRAALEIHAPHRDPFTVLTVGAGDILGWSWIIPPYRWRFDARALEDTRALALDGLCLRKKCDSDPALGYELMKRVSRVFADRLQTSRLQLLDLYGNPSRRTGGESA